MNTIEQVVDDELLKAEANCAEEKIHLPEKIQAHGYLLSMNSDCTRFLRASVNIDEIISFSAQSVLDIKPRELFGDASLSEIVSNVLDVNKSGALKNISCCLEGGFFDVNAFYSGDELVLELELLKNKDKNEEVDALFSIERFCSSLLLCNDESELINVFSKHIRHVTKFDRVKIYEFDESWNGKVVGESRVEGVTSYLGLNFPASDIPPQARALYEKNMFRLIANVNYTPVPIISAGFAGEAPLDLTYSNLRSVSPVHIRYLQNMEVGASMSISIMLNGKLWGLVACHNMQKRRISSRVRSLCGIMTHVFSAKLTAVQDEVTKQYERKLARFVQRLNLFSEGTPSRSVLARSEEAIMSLMGADGVVTVRGKERTSFGSVPAENDLEQLCRWYAGTPFKKVHATTDINALMSASGLPSGMTGGVLIAPIGLSSSQFVAWFRKPQVQQVIWAGQPQKSVEVSDIGTILTPRNSFKKWTSEVKHKSKTWELSAIAAAKYIVSAMLDRNRHVAEEQVKKKSDYISQVSHELRTPLSAMIAIIQTLMQEQNLSDSVRSRVTTLDVSSQVLMSLINDILDLDKMEYGATKLDFIEFTIEELLEEVRSVMCIQAENKGLSLNVNYGKDADRAIFTDFGKIRQVVFNLTSNAIKYTETGFVNISSSLETTKNGPKSHQLKIEVSDTGAGISEDETKIIFDKYAQAKPSGVNRVGSSGLGLAICKSFSDFLGGSIEVVSKEGVGSRFCFSVPVSLPEKIPETKDQHAGIHAIRPQEVSSHDSSRFANKRVLVAEDYEGNIVAISHLLKLYGFDVTIVNNGSESLSVIKQQCFDVVLMDVRMPKMDGIEATKKIRRYLKSKNKKHLPIIGMTANAMKGDKDECLNAGMDDYISKPLRLAELMEKIEALIS